MLGAIDLNACRKNMLREHMTTRCRQGGVGVCRVRVTAKCTNRDEAQGQTGNDDVACAAAQTARGGRLVGLSGCVETPAEDLPLHLYQPSELGYMHAFISRQVERTVTRIHGNIVTGRAHTGSFVQPHPCCFFWTSRTRPGHA